MKNERILPFAMATKLSEEDLQDVSAAGTSIMTGDGTYNGSGSDGAVDVHIDM